MGFYLAKFCATFHLTKCRGVWYNGNSARGVRPRAAAFVKYKFYAGGDKKNRAFLPYYSSFFFLCLVNFKVYCSPP